MIVFTYLLQNWQILQRHWRLCGLSQLSVANKKLKKKKIFIYLTQKS